MAQIGGGMRNSAISSDRTQLLQDDVETRGRSCCTHKRLLCFFIALLLIIAGHVIAIYYIHLRCTPENNCVPLKVMSLNTWGMPEKLGSEFKTQRMEAIGKEIQKGEFDIYLLEELWMQADHETIANFSRSANFSITGFRQLAPAACDGRVLPTYCSGLAIVSRFPFKEVEFNAYTYRGDPAKMFVDGEWFSRKGAGRVQIEPLPNVTVDVFATHTCADPDAWHGYNNSYYRKKQVRELMDKWISKSKADVVLLGGDFNAGPVEEDGSPFETVRKEMQNEIEEVLYKLRRWLQPEYTTYGNPDNTFSGQKYDPIMYDYIFRRTNSPEKVSVWTSLFKLPMFKTKVKKSLVSESILRNIEEIKNGHMPFHAYKSLNVTESDHKINEDKDEKNESSTEASKRSKRSNVEENEDEEEEQVPISFSDHEAVTSTMHLWASRSVQT